MATLRQKVECEQRMRELLHSADMPQPDAVEYGYTCVRFFFNDAGTCVVVDIDEQVPDLEA